MEFSPGHSPEFANPACDEVLYVLEGEGTLILDGRPLRVRADTGLYLAPHVTCSVLNSGDGPLLIVSSRCPEPPEDPPFGPAGKIPSADPAGAVSGPAVHLWDRVAETTADRWYRVLVDHRVGCRRVTQFVGSIPPGRAPDHFHEYEEVLCILKGEGAMWSGRQSASIGPGSTVFLPRGQVHCVENRGEGELRLLGVFYPAGSPAARYDPD